jgi:hypothetical protein
MMTRILVDPDQLRSLSTRFEQVSQDLRTVAGRANASWNNLDLITRQKAAVGGQVSEAVSRGHALAREAMVRANYLLTKAQAFEEADGQGAAGLPGVPIPPIPLPTPAPPKLPWPFPDLRPPILPSPVDLKRLLKTLLALKPVFFELLLDRLGVGIIKDTWDLLHINQVLDAWQEARSKYGDNSPQALDAEERLWESMPMIGPIIEALLDMGRANPVY